MTNYVVSAGQTSTGITLGKGDTETVLSGGIANNTVISGGSQTLSSGGAANKTQIHSGGTETVVAGGTVTSAVVSGGGVEVVSSGGTSNNLLVSSGGVEQGYAGGQAGGTQILSGGAIDLASRAFTSGGTADLNYSTDLLTISLGGVTLQDQLAGTYTGEYLHLSGAAVGTLVTLNTIPCYCRGTMILTEAGERAVEDLVIGDLVATTDGAMPIKWIGRRSYSDRFARGNRAVPPIRVAAGAIADGVPSRDLWVSAKHALLLDGVLIPAEALVNGVSITQASEVERVEYFHIELDRHAILFADGAAAESCVDDNGRGVFHNAHEYARLHPEADVTVPMYCASRHEDGERVEAVRRRLAQRALPTPGAGDFRSAARQRGRLRRRAAVRLGAARGTAPSPGLPRVAAGRRRRDADAGQPLPRRPAARRRRQRTPRLRSHGPRPPRICAAMFWNAQPARAADRRRG